MMLLPRGLTKKKVDLISVKRRRIEDKERPFRKAAGTPAAGDAISARADPTIEQIIWTNAVYVCLFENVFSSDDLKLVRQPVTNFVTCHSVASKAKLTDVAPSDLVSALRLVGEDRIQIRLALGTEEAEAGSAFEFRLLDTDGTNIFENISHVAYLESVPALYQSISGITHLVHRNLKEDTASSAALIRGITPIGLTAKNESSYEQVLIAFSDHSAREEFLGQVPWHDQAVSGNLPTFCSCLKSCSFERFVALKEEYLAHQNKLNMRMVVEQPVAQSARPNHEAPQAFSSVPRSSQPPSFPVFQSKNLSYPPGRLLFLRNVPTNTNKTAIRADMTALLGEFSNVDYVDWSKGHDTAFIRLGRTISEEVLAEVLETGTLEGDSKVELLSGERESVYWSRLPEKIRAAAMEG